MINSYEKLNAESIVISLLICRRFNGLIAGLPDILHSYTKMKISLRRLVSVLNETEFENIENDLIEDDIDIRATSASFRWNSSQAYNTLNDISVEIKKNSLVVIIGPVGSGKSSFLSALMGNMNKTSGFLTKNKRSTFSFVSQDAWILNSTIRENITFMQQFDDHWYKTVLKACALDVDIKTLPNYDFYAIADNGENLSGGQKQRLNIARAVYRNSDVYLFDDPLSAVDGTVAKHIFTRVFGSSGLLRTKTRIIVTHSSLFLPQADFIFVMDAGCIVASGTYKSLIEQGYLKENSNENISEKEIDEKNLEDSEVDEVNKNDFEKINDEVGRPLQCWDLMRVK
ncbi:canalicular multispecific organic anion transporter 2-like protein [Dinothrombium tinctorium]|uniref:Canalicular multispecific organic anion transporter 2-like protein n=1 Tax=Dinothrombium tinctorium TaxID=1965070 RepID=A0A3S3NQN5_9ACAR|nr:canalicular multispecific organic anion transporter 2-like protein [Dinothrombium tinctorium]